MTSEPLISVIMAVYNSERYLSEAIDSVISQSYKNWELICINDGSTDSSLKILEGYRDKEPRLIIVDQLNSGTASGARNAGIKISRGEFIVVMDSDDVVEENYLSKLHQRYQETKAEVVIASLHFWDYKNNKTTRSIIGVEGDVARIITGREAFLLSLNWRIGALGLYKRENLLSIGGYDTVGVNGDEYTSRLLFLNANRIAFCHAGYLYRNNLESTTKKFSVRLFEKGKTSYRLFQLIKNNNFDIVLLKLEKERLFKLLLSRYYTCFKERSRLANNYERVKEILYADSRDLYNEFLQQPMINSRVKHRFYTMLLSKHKLLLTYSVIRGKILSLIR